MNARVRSAGLLLLLLAAGLPAQAAPGFLQFLWVSSAGRSAAMLERVRAAGYHGINLGGGDPVEPLAAAGLTAYLDQPAGKGLLELRDADWTPLQQAYERTRDGSLLLRPTCLLDEAARVAAVSRTTAALAAVTRARLQFVALADEASATRHANPLDLCRCPRCLLAFRGDVLLRHGGLESLNVAWGTAFARDDDVVPWTTDQVRRRELGLATLPQNLQPWNDWLDFVDRQFAAAVAAQVAAVQAAAPGLPVGLTGMQPPSAFGGHDFARLLPLLSAVEVYDLGGADALARSLLPPSALTFATLFPPSQGQPAAPVLAQLTALAMHGTGGMVVWNSDQVFTGDGLSQFGAAVQAACTRQQAVLDACAGAVVQPSPVWLLESQTSVRAAWMLDSAGDGASWVRRLSSYEASHSTSLANRRSWVALLRDLGLQPRFVVESALPERLLQQPPRVLVLPGCLALADRTCQAIETYVQNGGTVLADHTPALYDDALRLRPKGRLDALFGVASRTRRFEDLLVREGKATGPRLRSGVGIAEQRLQAEPNPDADRRYVLSEPTAAGQPVFLERRPGRGRALYLDLVVAEYGDLRLDPKQVEAARDLRARVRSVLAGAGVEPPFEVRGQGLPTCLERAVLRTRQGQLVFAVRVAALERPEVLHQVGRSGPVPVHVLFPAARELQLLGGNGLGRADRFDCQLDAEAGLFLVEARR